MFESRQLYLVRPDLVGVEFDPLVCFMSAQLVSGFYYYWFDYGIWGTTLEKRSKSDEVPIVKAEACS